MSILELSASKCVKCAKCIPECTIYGVNRDEITSPRGYLDLVESYANGKLKMDLDLKNSIESCFLCTTCVTNCPLSLPIDLVIERARVDIAKIYGISLYKKIAFYLLGKRSILNIVFKIGFYFNPCMFKKDKGFNLPRISLPKIGKRVIMPLNKKSFLEKHKENIKNTNTKEIQNANFLKKNNKNRVAIFIGCLSNYNYINVGDSLLEILKFLQIDVFLAKKQCCCGAPAFFSGDIKNTTILIKKNINYFLTFIDSVDAILIPEATCAAALKVDWEHALDIEEEVFKINNSFYKEKIKLIKPKFEMASKWLHDNTNLKSYLKKMKLDITYHDPCHAKKVLKIFKEPRNLLSNCNLKEMKESNVCCGFGGVTMQAEKYHLAQNVGDRKAKNIKDSNAKIVSAECGACRMQIDDALHRNNVDSKFMHPLEIIAKSLA